MNLSVFAAGPKLIFAVNKYILYKFEPVVFNTLCEHGALVAVFCLPKHSLSLLEKITHGGLNPGGKAGREGVVSECVGPSVSVPASHGELPDKPVILTGQISAEKPSTLKGFAQLIRQSHLQISSSTLLPLTPGGCTPASCAPRPRVGHHTRCV